ncbi:septum site-determining protein MinC [Lactiplantibacillus fabifermentans]|uniref:Septum site-determining protein MinC n=2 Tax=Lactiplantibacillus fabifermentans TaxID=483011 RepID=A0A0R2N8V8_9LACO|nr:septum site-determining protein MinC [Lactiplantibacillus fabifermentans]ETY73864.1 septum site-determining protein MinC [Lactiplantibacillus fabifermentans T30PCM01]KRO22265.1 septum site-determining protein MinC [Lactiplantibacillus fabifermentans DSM 21115]
MQQSVVLKASSDGYELIFRQSASFDDIMADLKTLLDRLQLDNTTDKEISFDMSTEGRLLTTEQNTQVTQLVNRYELFSIHKLTADVILTADALAMIDRNTVHLVNQIIRNGQVLEVNGDVLFFGKIHEGGVLRATGSIFVMGDISGSLEAGYPDHADAVIVSPLATVPRVRVGELLELVDPEKIVAGTNVVYINDIQALDYQPLNQLKRVRPKLFTRNGGHV